MISTPPARDGCYSSARALSARCSDLTLTAALTDEDLALKASRGDKDAFGVLYERHYRGVYDLVVRMVREHELAVDVVQNSFLNAWTNLQKRTVTGNIKAWLYTIARNSAITELRRGKRTVNMGEEIPEGKYPPAFARVDADRLADPQNIVADAELVDLVWTSAAALSAREYSLLDLHVRRGLSTDDLSQTLGVPKSNLYTQLSRLKDSLEESVTVNLLMRRARNDCPQLDSLAAAAGAGLTRDVRQVIARHVRDCERCTESRKRYLAPAEIFAGLALVPAPIEAERLWLGATAGAGFLALIVASFLIPIRWLLGVVKGAGAPLKAVLGTSLVATVAVPAVMVTLVNLDGGNSPTRPEPAAAGVQPRVARSPAASPVALTPAPTSEATPAPQIIPEPVVLAAIASPVAGQVVALAPAPTPTPTPVLLSPAGGATPTPTPTTAPAPAAPAPIAVQINLTPPKQVQLHSSATLLVTIFGTQSLPVSNLSLPTVGLGGGGVRQDHSKDVNNDGEPDLLLHFKLADIIIPASGEVCLEGQTLAGMRFAGCTLLI
jgi:RNA polymerase sigma factor (sigma-70 family)